MKNTKEWLEFLTAESELYQDIVLKQRLNDVTGLGGALSQMIRRGRSERYPGVLLTGPAGSGKHNAAWHIIQTLNEENAAPVFLTGEDLNEFAGDFSELTAHLNALLDHFFDRPQTLCLVLEEPDACSFSRKLYSFLGRTLHYYQGYPAEDPTLFLILIAEQQPSLPSLLQDQLLLCPCTLPDRERRQAFLNEKGKLIRNYVPLKHLAELTEGCSYAALGQIVDMLGFRIDATEQAPSEEDLRRCVRQLAPREEQQQQNGNSPVAEALGRLESVFSELIGKLSELDLSKLNVNGGPAQKTQSFTAGNVQTNAEPGMELSKADAEAMPVRQLSAELFGEERAAQLLAN